MPLWLGEDIESEGGDEGGVEGRDCFYGFGEAEVVGSGAAQEAEECGVGD